jgi:antitoxin (DNA-binding transcriptional repressor) of toxin-antitoxin stability system
MHEAKSTLSQLVKKAAGGETVYIGGYGTPQVALVAVNTVRPKKRLGILADRLVVPDDFDAPLPAEVLEGFYGT